jgi:hypothetical protein
MIDFMPSLFSRVPVRVVFVHALGWWVGFKGDCVGFKGEKREEAVLLVLL